MLQNPARLQPLRLLPALLGLALLSLACADSGGGGSETAAAATASEGAVGILLTDAPADPSLFAEINLLVERVELVGDADSREVLYDGDGQSIDLLDLRTHSTPLGLHRAVPAGRYCRIRLTVDEIELVLTTGERVEAVRPGNSGRIEVVPGACIEVGEGEMVLLQLDVDAGRSIHIVEAPPGSRRFLFRPVIHADLVGVDFEEKVVRVEGTLADFDVDDQELLVCDVIPVVSTQELPAYRGCVTTRVMMDSSFFDNIESEGRPRALDDLFDETWIGERIAVVGRVDATMPPRPVVRVPPGHYPPRGRCKVWYVGRPPGQQPPPSSCRVDLDDLPDGAVLVDDHGRPVLDHEGLLALDAFVFQLGDALRLTGIVDAEPVDDIVPVLLDPGQSVTSDEPIDVVVQEAPVGGNGTQILTTTGEPLSVADVLVDDPVTVDGVLVVDTPDFIRAALILVDVDRAGEVLATGDVVELLDDGFTLDLESNPCRSGTSLDVLTDDETRTLVVTITDEGSTTAIADGVALGDEVSATGVCDPDGLLASVVLVIDDQRDPSSM